MGRRKKNQLPSADTIPPPAPITPALDIRRDGIYRPEQVRQALGLRASSLRTEWRRGRLRIVRRCGRNFLLGHDVLAWLDGGEVRPPTERAYQAPGG